MKYEPTDCIYQNTTETPCSGSCDTSLTLNLDGEKVQVKVCDGHSEEASVKTAKEAYLNKRKEFDEFVAKAKSLGIKLSESNSGLVIGEAPQKPKAQPAPQRRPQPQQVDPTLITDDDDESFVDVFTAENRDVKTRITAHSGVSAAGVGGRLNEHNLASVRQTLGSKMVGGKVRQAIAEGRDGAPVIIPQVKIDGTGLLRVRVSKTMDKSKFDDRFKNMAKASLNDQVHFANDGYATEGGVRDCPLCEGEGQIQNRGAMHVCPKCQGAGSI